VSEVYGTTARDFFSYSNGDKMGCRVRRCAIEDDIHVFKIFYNPFHPTYRKLDHWLSAHSWISELNVVKHLEF
jgi:hypothetical protein